VFNKGAGIRIAISTRAIRRPVLGLALFSKAVGADRLILTMIAPKDSREKLREECSVHSPSTQRSTALRSYELRAVRRNGTIQVSSLFYAPID